MMALAYKLIIFFFFVISHVEKTTTSTTHYVFVKTYTKNIRGKIQTFSVEPDTSTPSSVIVTRPTSVNTFHEVTFNFSNVGLQKIGSEFIKSDDIISLSLDNNNISDISQYAFRRMRNLHYLDLSTNRISKDKILSFSETDRLTTLIINNNNDSSNVKVLKEYGIFSNLKHLHLCNNQLKDMQIPFNVTTPRLTTLHLSNNSITSNSVFDYIPWTLIYLHLDKNSIDRVEQDKLRNLQELVMNNNTITKVCFECSGESISLKSATYMRKLILSGNLISEVSSDAFRDTARLEYLDLSNNKIADLDKNVFSNMLNLVTLSLANNTLATVPNLCSMSQLKILDLAGNRIGAVHSTDFKCNNMQLQYLFLSNNDMTTIQTGAFFYLPSLKYLDLSENHLMELPTQWSYITYHGYNYTSSSGLQELHLERNNINTVDDVSLTGLTSLQHVYLDENSILTLNAKSIKNLPLHLTFHVGNMREKSYIIEPNNIEPDNNTDESDSDED